ncbi:hypothetical protein BH09PLA1_BH09PLA1_14790 [soil metagenome]
MISVESAITRVQRSVQLSSALNGLLVAVIILFPLLQAKFKWPIDSIVALSIVGAVWIFLFLQSMRSSRLVADSPSLIAAGQFDIAEQKIDTALRSFSIFRAVKLLGLHHLAALRHAQNRWQDAATLCRALLAQRRVAGQGIGRSTQLMLADSLLELDDVPGVGNSLAHLYTQRLSLGEALSLLLVQLDFESRVGSWQNMMQGVSTKATLAELMPTNKSARAQAFLALAARKTGRDDWESWLRRRVELLVDPQELCVRRPILRELWLA